MPRWRVTHGDILDVPADVLVCSANPFLTLSGGVGGAFALRYGPAMQEYLTGLLETLEMRHVRPGTLIETPPCGSPYRGVLHAVGVDAWYDSSPEIVTQLIEHALSTTARIGANSIAIPAIATGYGHLTIDQFAEALRPLLNIDSPVGEIIICLRREHEAARVRELLGIED